MTILSAALLLILVMDPFGNLPFFLTALSGVEPRRQRRIILRELLFALVALLVFLFAGPSILSALHISEPALTLSGGIILFLISLRMIFPGMRGGFEEEVDGEPFIVPLAIPFIAGPSAMASVLFIVNREPERWLDWTIALLLAWAATGLVLFTAPFLSRVLGKRGLVAIERLMGMLLTTLSVQMFMTGVAEFMALKAGS